MCVFVYCVHFQIHFILAMVHFDKRTKVYECFKIAILENPPYD